MPRKKKNKIAVFYNDFIATKGRPLSFKIFVTILVFAVCLMLIVSLLGFLQESKQ